MTPSTGTHPDPDALLALVADGATDESDGADGIVAAHVAGCRTCAGEVAALRARWAPVVAERALTGSLDAPAGLLGGVLAQLRTVALGRQALHRPRPQAASPGTWVSALVVRRVAALAAVAEADVVGLGAGRGRPGRPPTEVALGPPDAAAGPVLTVPVVLADDVAIGPTVERLRAAVAAAVEAGTGIRLAAVDVIVVDLAPRPAGPGIPG